MQPSASSPCIKRCEAMAEILSKKKIEDIQRPASTYAFARLNDLIHLTYKWLRTRVSEYDLRVKTFSRVSEILVSHLRSTGIQAATVLYGSLATCLYLPESDIDIYLESPLYTVDPFMIAELLKASGKYCNIFVSGKDERRCVKVVDSETSIRIDITFSAVTALAAVDHVMDFKIRYPLLEPVVLILKYLMNLKGLDRTASPNGGLSSYGLVLMIMNFLKGHRPPCTGTPDHQQFTSLTGHNYEGEDISKVNLAELFCEFFDVYGNNLDLSKVALSGNDGFVWKKSLEETMGLNPASSIFTLQDPVQPDNDVGYNVYLMGQVGTEFAAMHRSISEVKQTNELCNSNFYCDLLLTNPADVLSHETEANSDGDSSSEDSSVEEDTLVKNQMPVPSRFVLCDDFTPACYSSYALNVQSSQNSFPVVDPCPIRYRACIVSYPYPTGIVVFPLDSTSYSWFNSCSPSPHSPVPDVQCSSTNSV